MEKIEFNVWIECRDNLPISEQVPDSPAFNSKAVEEAVEAFRKRLVAATIKRRGYVMLGYGPTFNEQQRF